MNDLEKAKRLFFEAVHFCNIADYASAELRLRKALKFAPGNASILTNLSTVALRREKFDEARKLAETALASNRNNIEALMVLTACQVRKSQFADALAGCDRIIALEPRIAEVHGNRGNALGHLKRHEEALAAFDMALRLQPDLAEARLGRGNTLFQLRRYEQALAAYDFRDRRQSVSRDGVARPRRYPGRPLPLRRGRCGARPSARDPPRPRASLAVPRQHIAAPRPQGRSARGL